MYIFLKKDDILQKQVDIFLEEMLISSARAAQTNEVPVRAFNVFFGLGIPSPLQAEGFSDVLQPLEPLSDKLLILRNDDQIRCDESGINAHYDGASGACTEAPSSLSRFRSRPMASGPRSTPTVSRTQV